MFLWEDDVIRETRIRVVKASVRPLSWRDLVHSHLRRLPLEILNLLINYDWLFKLVGYINKRKQFIGSVFLVYPATEVYALQYVYKSRLPSVKWNPWPCGLLMQNGKVTITFCISASTTDFEKTENEGELKSVANRMEQIRLMFGAQLKTFAGVLPGVLFKKRILRVAPEADLTARAVYQAMKQVIELQHLPMTVPVLVIGGQGFIGKRLLRLGKDLEIKSIDPANGTGEYFPTSAFGARCLVVNLANTEAVANILGCLDRNSVILTETYPEPPKSLVRKIEDNHCFIYHVVGVVGTAYPPFPGAYKGAIPCCAAWPSTEMKAVVRELNSGSML